MTTPTTTATPTPPAQPNRPDGHAQPATGIHSAGSVRPARPTALQTRPGPARRGPLATAAVETWKRAIRRLLRPALVPLEDAIAGAGGWHAWRGGLEGSLNSAIGDVHLERRLRDELAYWVQAIGSPKGPQAHAFHERFAQWQADRADELVRWLDIQDLARWQADAAVVEIGSGPHPFVAHGSWRLAVAVDPLCDGYTACSLWPPGPMRFVPIAAPGEQIPLPAGCFDLVVCDNCLDHVADPGRVVAEIARLLRPGGHAWILVDLRTTVDDLHPHAFTAELLGVMLQARQLQIVRQRQSSHASHPLAQGEIRVLARKPDHP